MTDNLRQLTVAVPNSEMAERLSPAPEGVSLIVWDILDAPLDTRIDLLVMHYMIKATALSALAGLPIGVIQAQSLGFDGVLDNLPAGLTYCNAVDVHEASTAELALALILASLRNLPELVISQAKSEWLHSQAPGLAGQTVLLVGVGGVGREIEARLLPFDVNLIRMGRSARMDDRGIVHGLAELPDILPTADIVILAVPLSPETHHFVSTDFLSRMKQGALVVNISRGPIVDTNALVDRVKEGAIRAALDVTDPEPLPHDHPLWLLPGVIITPHIGGHTEAMAGRMDRVIRDQITLLSQGLPPKNVVVRS
jgi:phosphoglycerate dehydrogenase-like enzyme